jgi:uncharacterized protein YfiM (DUF2279 family)
VKKWIFYIFLIISINTSAQETIDTAYAIHPGVEVENKFNSSRFNITTGIHAASYTATLLILSQTWYKDHPRSSFQFFDDSKEWLQVDKVGHSWTTYNLAKYSKSLWIWSGVEDKKATWLGGLSGLGYQTILEILDAHSAEWGWSWTDMAANVAGAALFTSQEFAWKQQKVLLKFSSHRVQHPFDLQNRANNLFGKTLPERLLKDYNGQTYWLSFNLPSITNSDALPPWLNIAVGYGAKGLYGGFENFAVDKTGAVVFDRRDVERLRQWYLSPDIDFTRIKTNNKGMRTALHIINMLKVPAPAMELTSGRLKFRWFYF